MGIELQKSFGSCHPEPMFNMGRNLEHNGCHDLIGFISYGHDASSLMDVAKLLLRMVVDLEAFSWFGFEKGERNILSGSKELDKEAGFLFLALDLIDSQNDDVLFFHLCTLPVWMMATV